MKPSFISRWNRWLACWGFAWVIPVATLVLYAGPSSRVAAAPVERSNEAEDRAAGMKAFARVASVIRSPRCINCHPAGDVPRQTKLQLPHFPPVARGADGRGMTGMRCNACHQGENQSNGIPGAPHWGLAPRSMAWVGLNDHDLAEQLKDPSRNGQRSLAQMIDHVSNERLVLWAWHPGGTREAPPLTHEQFIQSFKAWVAAGAPSPQSTKR